MGWLSSLGGIFKGGKEVAEVFVENKENKGQRQHDAFIADVDRDLASLQQFSKEFHERQNRSWWDSFVDGLNRLPRPLITIAILSFFVLAPLDPVQFTQIAQAYNLMPDGYWMLLSVIIGFYFGGRMQLKMQDMSVSKDAVKAAKDLVAMRREFRQLEIEEESPQSKIYDNVTMSSGKPVNKVVEEWKQKKK